jgi:hypothetical protein
MKHAIFLRGSIRTWNFTKHKIIDFFNQYHDNPDWYVCLWNSSSSTISQVKDDFKNSNLKFLKFVDTKEYYDFKGLHNVTPNYWRLAYLDYHLSLAKRTNELNENIRYHTVTFIRPDIIYKNFYLKPSDYVSRLNTLQPMETTYQNLGNHNKTEDDYSFCTLVENYFVNDFIICAGEFAADIYGTRFVDPEYTDGIHKRHMNWDPHQNMAYIQSRSQLFNKLNYLYCAGEIIRPNSVFEDQSHKDWNLLSKDERKALCHRANIDLYDYQLDEKPRYPSNL